TAAVVNAQPGLEFLCVGHEEVVADVTLQCRREMHLLLYGKAAARQPLEEARQLRIAQPAVERPGLGEMDTGTDARLELIVEVFRVATQPQRLQLGTVHFMPDRVTASGQQ